MSSAYRSVGSFPVVFCTTEKLNVCSRSFSMCETTPTDARFIDVFLDLPPGADDGPAPAGSAFADTSVIEAFRVSSEVYRSLIFSQ